MATAPKGTFRELEVLTLADGPTAVSAPNIVSEANDWRFTFWTKLNIAHITLSLSTDRTRWVWQMSYRSRRTRSS